MIQRTMLLMLARLHEEFLGRMVFNLMRYKDSDILLFGVPSTRDTTLLVVVVKRPCVRQSS
jgi:hypothetical protein